MCTHRGGAAALSTGGNPTVTASVPAAALQQPTPRMRITGNSLAQLLNTTTDGDTRDALMALRDVNAANTTAGTAPAGFTKTLSRANTPQGTAAAWFSDASTRQKILNLLGDGYEFVQLTNSNRGNFMGVGTMTIKTWRLRKKSAANG